MDPGYYHEDFQRSSGSSDWAGYIALFLIIIIIIGIVVFVINNGGASSFLFKWTVANLVSANSIMGDGGAYYIITGNQVSAIIVAPPDPIGQTFIIDNSGSTVSLSLSFPGNTKIVGAGEIVTFVWTTTTEASVVARTTN